VNAVAFSPDGRYVLTGSADHTAKLWSVASSKLVRTWTYDSPVGAIAFSPDGRHALTGLGDGTADLFDLSPRAVSPQGRGFSLVRRLVQAELDRRLKLYQQLPTPLASERDRLVADKPEPPKLVKDEFETTAAFNARIAAAPRKYAAAVTAYNTKMDRLAAQIQTYRREHRTWPVAQRNRIIHDALSDAFLKVFGRPKLKNLHYDADNQIFFVNLSADGDLAGDFKRTLAVGPIPPEEARRLKGTLASGKPVVVFSIDDDGTIRWKEAHIEAAGKQYPAVLTDVNFKLQHIEIPVTGE